MNLTEILEIVALVVFVVAAVGWSYKKTDLVAVGLAVWVLALLLGRLSHINLSTIVLILAFVAFVLAAIGWRYKKVGLIAAGLGLWVLSIVLP
jgi:hypothetical protein